jgi:hypothetical protein
MLTDYQYVVTQGNLFIEEQLNHPTFIWQSNTYNFIPSITEYKLQLDTGGFSIRRLLTATVRLYQLNGTAIFTSIPQPQQIITYTLDNNNYRIETVKQSADGATLRIVAHSMLAGV